MTSQRLLSAESVKHGGEKIKTVRAAKQVLKNILNIKDTKVKNELQINRKTMKRMMMMMMRRSQISMPVLARVC